MKIHQIRIGRLSIFLLLISFQSCAPVFSDLQSARLVGKDNIELTPSYSSVSWAEDGQSQTVQNHYGVQAGFGLEDNLDLRARIEYIHVKNYDEESINATVIGVAPKFSIVKDRMAGFLPVGTAFGNNIETSKSWEIQPTLLFTFPITDLLQFNPSAKYIIPLISNSENLVAINLGLGIGEYGKFVIRPEYGLLFNPGESGHYSHFSIGVNVFPKWE